MNNLKENLDNVSSRLTAACEAAGRVTDSVRLLAVSKRHPADKIQFLYEHGLRAFGENIVAEATEKRQALKNLDIEWHFIGPIQSNKTREIAATFAWVQSVDRIKILRRLSDQRPASLPPLNICLQVNIDGETQKAGCAPENTMELAESADALPNIRLRGLMAIPRYKTDLGGTDPVSFQKLKALYDECQAAGFQLDTLSMGMSADLEQAIASGSTMVRIGTDIFGKRPQ